MEKTSSRSELILVFGPEEFLRKEQIDRIREEIDPQARAFDEAHLTAVDDSLPRIFSELNTRPVLSKRRLVWLSHCERWKAGDVDEFKKGFEKISSLNILALEAEELRANHALLRFAKTHGKVFSCAAPQGPALLNWIKSYTQKQQMNLDPRVPALLIERMDGNLSDIAKALDRMALFSKEKKGISLEEAEKLIPPDRTGVLFELTDAFCKKDAGRALGLIHHMLRAGRRIPEIIGLLFWQLKQLATAREYRDQRRSAQDLAHALRRQPFMAERLMRQARSFTREEISRDLKALVQADIKTKSSGMKDRLVLEMLVLRLCGLETI